MKTEIEGTTSHNPDPKQATAGAQRGVQTDPPASAPAPTTPTSSAAKAASIGPAAPAHHRRRALSPFDLWSAGPFELMRRFFGDSGFADLGVGDFGRAWFDPKIDVFDRGDELVVRADLPGVRKEDLIIEAAGDHLVIGGERQDTRENRDGGHYRSERSYGSFHRTIPLPEGADVEHAKASFEHGVLEVTVKTPQRAQRRRIEIGDAPDTGPKVH